MSADAKVLRKQIKQIQEGRSKTGNTKTTLPPPISLSVHRHISKQKVIFKNRKGICSEEGKDMFIHVGNSSTWVTQIRSSGIPWNLQDQPILREVSFFWTVLWAYQKQSGESFFFLIHDFREIFSITTFTPMTLVDLGTPQNNSLPLFWTFCCNMSMVVVICLLWVTSSVVETVFGVGNLHLCAQKARMYLFIVVRITIHKYKCHYGNLSERLPPLWWQFFKKKKKKHHQPWAWVLLLTFKNMCVTLSPPSFLIAFYSISFSLSSCEEGR